MLALQVLKRGGVGPSLLHLTHLHIDHGNTPQCMGHTVAEQLRHSRWLMAAFDVPAAAETEARARVAGAHSQQEVDRAEAILAETIQTAREMHALKARAQSWSLACKGKGSEERIQSGPGVSHTLEKLPQDHVFKQAHI